MIFCLFVINHQYCTKKFYAIPFLITLIFLQIKKIFRAAYVFASCVLNAATSIHVYRQYHYKKIIEWSA